MSAAERAVRLIVVVPTVIALLLQPLEPRLARRRATAGRFQPVKRVGAPLRSFVGVEGALDAERLGVVCRWLGEARGALGNDVVRILRVGLDLDPVRVAPLARP